MIYRKLFLIVSEPRKETSVNRAVIYDQIIVKCRQAYFDRHFAYVTYDMSCEL